MSAVVRVSCIVAGSLAIGVIGAGTAAAAPGIQCGSSATPTLAYNHMRVINGTCRQGRQMVLDFRRAVRIPGCYRQPNRNDIHITCGSFKGMFTHVVSFSHPEWRLTFKGRTVFVDANGGVD